MRSECHYSENDIVINNRDDFDDFFGDWLYDNFEQDDLIDSIKSPQRYSNLRQDAKSHFVEWVHEQEICYCQSPTPMFDTLKEAE